jgi:hypothetical protein
MNCIGRARNACGLISRNTGNFLEGRRKNTKSSRTVSIRAESKEASPLTPTCSVVRITTLKFNNKTNSVV